MFPRFQGPSSFLMQLSLSQSFARLISRHSLPVYSPSAVRRRWLIGSAASSATIRALFPCLLPPPLVLINSAVSSDMNPDGTAQVLASVGSACFSFLFTLFDISIYHFHHFHPDVSCCCSDEYAQSKMAASGAFRHFRAAESVAPNPNLSSPQTPHPTPRARLMCWSSSELFPPP